MIRASHTANCYSKPSFTEGPLEFRLQEVLARLMQHASEDGLAMRDSGLPTPDEFARRFEDVRDMLVGRKLLGEQLAADEELVLSEINAALRAVMVKPMPDSGAVLTALEEAKLILSGVRRGDD